MNVLSIQSSVAVGHVGNSAAVPALQRLGVNVWPVNTVQLSNHPGHATWRGAAAPASLVSDIVAGIDALGVLATCDALLTGYLGDASLGAVVLDTLGRLRAANPDAVFACDPVLGDDGTGVYVSEGVAAYLRDAMVPRADILTPNRYEAEFLARQPIAGIDDALRAVETLRARGPQLVAVTSAPAGGDAGVVGTLAADAGGAWLVRTPRLDTDVHGAGDLFSALLLGHWLRRDGLAAALSRAVSGLHAVLAATAASKAPELLLIETQDALAAPPRLFPAERLR